MMLRRLRDAAWPVVSGCLRPLLGGLGCILTLHRVVPEGQRSALPSNRALEITPEDLRAMLQWLQRKRIEVVGLDAVPGRLRESSGGRFVSITFDDGYRDNLTLARPIFREFGAPFAVNVVVSRGAGARWADFLRVCVEGREASPCDRDDRRTRPRAG
jgi:peptidoglycan/xylan/chitin deacetylase (PgdA/CDA1 family)